MSEATGSLIVVGPGERLEELAAALSGLLARARGPRARLVALEDLAQLLLFRAEAGVLLLDGDGVPAEDIGILRRFLEARPAWRLSWVGAGSPAGLASLPRTAPLPWPPDLDALRALARGQAPAASAAGASNGRPPAPAARPAPGAVDLVLLLDDLIVGRAVGEDAADYGFEPSGELPVRADRDELASVLEGFLGLAESCAGRDRRVEVATRGEGAEARVEIHFPPGALTDGDLPALFENGAFSGPPELRSAVEGAREAAELAAQLEGRVRLSGDRGRLRLELSMPLAR